ncbi:DMT family transporter [Jannaschia sp. LMIT008]|uniref:DMT family transporter n=1 Tax=Jannaschia maritima TaxID=3032585 RepID=UPI0028117EF5|nr:DMT family transporter [Jannaschia sp. LMIT008]
MSGRSPPGEWRGVAWLLADIGLNVWALTIVKATGAELSAWQLVFLRAAVGLALMVPWIAWSRAEFRRARRPGLHLLRIALSAVTLTASFHAVARLPFALFTAMNFTRPLVMIAMAALFLAEPATPRRWAAALLGLAGVVVAVGPTATPDPALLAMAVTVLCGTGAIVVTRKLNDQPPVVLMTAYTAGLALATAGPALAAWRPVSADLWPVLLAVGLFAQGAQFCFLRAHRFATAGRLAIAGYAGFVLTTAIGWAVFGEWPAPAFWPGAAAILFAGWLARPVRGRGADR